MSKFLITYHGPGMPDDPALAAQAKAAFGKWLGEAGKAVVDPGAPVRTVAKVTNGSSGEFAIGGYTVIEAASRDEVIRLLKTHPFVARGGMLQVNEVIAV